MGISLMEKETWPPTVVVHRSIEIINLESI